MAGLTWIKFKKSGQTKQISSKIANNKDYQNDPDRGFTIVGEPIQESNPAPQKKIELPKKDVVESNEEVNQDVTAQVETVTLPNEAETIEQKVTRLHKEGKTEEEIKAETGINKLTIRSIIKKIK